MTDDQRKKLIDWLSNAHAMELQIVEVLEHHEADAKDFPEVATKIREHREASRKHAEMVKSCLRSLDADPSSLKDINAQVGGNIAGVGSKIMNDTLIKNAITDYTTEHMEIAVYKTIGAVARSLGENTIVESCENIIEDEEDMATWLEENIESLAIIHFDMKTD